jgi:hypothetical protein
MKRTLNIQVILQSQNLFLHWIFLPGPLFGRWVKFVVLGLGPFTLFLNLYNLFYWLDLLDLDLSFYKCLFVMNLVALIKNNNDKKIIILSAHFSPQFHTT